MPATRSESETRSVTGDGGLSVSRRYTEAGTHPFDMVEWEIRDAIIGSPEKPAFEQHGVEFPTTWSQNATNIVAQKYFRGQLNTAQRESSVKQMIGRVAGTIATWGREGGYFATPEDADAFEAELTYILLNQLAAFNSPVWFNVGFEEQPQCSACFILSVEDELTSILEWNTKEGMIFRGGSGSGINLSKIRSSKEPLSKGGLASGPVSFMRGADAWAGTIKSGGKTRRAAKMVVLDIDHPDIVEFIWCKANEELKAAALRDAGFDMRLDSDAFASIQYQNANNSVRVTDEFMKAVDRGGKWHTLARTTRQPVDEYDARDLMNQIADAAWRCADPGVQYDTIINEWHTCPNSGRINASNPCCFVGETLVATDEGPVPIEDLYARASADDSLPSVEAWDVHSHSGPTTTQINAVWIAGYTHELVEVETAAGHKFRCTPDHRFLTDTGEWVEARSLQRGTEVRAIRSATAGYAAVLDKVLIGCRDRVAAVCALRLDEPVPVYDLEADGVHNFVVTSSAASAGLVVHNSEYMHVDDSACNLASINLMKFRKDDGTFDTEAFEHVVDIVFLAQEIVVGPSSYPTEEIGRNARAFRQIGLGYANLGALLMSNGMPYDSDEGRAVAAAITALMTGRAYRKSAEIAAAIGPYDEYEKNRIPHNRVMEKHRAAAYEIGGTLMDEDLMAAARHAWDEAVAFGDEHGYRNAQATVLAPTGTISFLMDCDTTGIEPDFSLVKFKELVGGGTMTIVNRTVPLALETLGYSVPEIEQIEAYINDHGTIVDAPGLKEEHLPVFDVAVGDRAISHMGHIKMMAAVQPFISGAISKTVNMPNEVTVEDIADAYIQGWKLGLKALAIYRDGSKTAQALSTNTKKDEPVKSPAEGQAEGTDPKPVRRRMPKERQSLTHKFSVGGHEGYITAGMYEDGTVGEIFLTDVGKEGSTIKGMMNAFATAMSIGLQYGVPLETFVEKFAFMRFEPEGYTGNPEVPFAKSMPDYIVRWLAARFCDTDMHEQMGIMTPEVRARKAAQEALMRGDTAGPAATDASDAPAANGSGNGNGGAAKPEAAATPKPAAEALTVDAPAAAPAKLVGLDLGPACNQCGGMMQRTGSCYTCPSCGNNTGCG
jgi:ribonucleotide reductase alpha subunit